MTTPAPRSMARLYWLALGTFATGTEGFMIAPLLPDLARDFSVSLVAAGQLVTVFSLTYALSSPVLTALTGDLGRARERAADGHPYGGRVSGHPLDPLRARNPGLERIAKILGLADHLPIDELHNTHGVRRPPVIG